MALSIALYVHFHIIVADSLECHITTHVDHILSLRLSRYVGKFKHRLRDFGQDQPFTNVYVKNFGDELTDEELFKIFARYGKILSAKVMVDHATGRSVHTHTHNILKHGRRGV